MKLLTIKTHYVVIACLLTFLSEPVAADVIHTFSAGDTIHSSEMNENFDALDTRITTLEALEVRITALEAHAADTNNPHNVNKAQVGLGNVDDIRLNATAMTAPSVSDDSFNGYPVGSVWINTTNSQAYVLVDATPAAAVWQEINRTYNIGDIGPAGGIVFYIYDGGKHGLEAATDDQDGGMGAVWGCYGSDIAGANGTDIGTGARNTIAILDACTTAGTAAKLADAYVSNGYTDWFLPSKDELNLLFGQKDIVGGFADYYYWSSLQGSIDGAWSQDFSDGRQTNFGKNFQPRVRAVRAF